MPLTAGPYALDWAPDGDPTLPAAGAASGRSRGVAKGRWIRHNGAHERAYGVSGGPDLSADQLQPGRFNRPRYTAADPDGTRGVVERISGGHFFQLARR